MNHPLVSVAMITYNHGEFIEEALKGVLMQECDFEMELVLANDASMDDTDAVIKRVLQEHPHASRVNYINRPENIGMKANFIDVLRQCRGKYIAICEGDDYWTDSLKLKKQVAFMESRPQLVFSFHNGDRLIQRSGELLPYFKLGDLKLRDRSIVPKQVLLKIGGGAFPTASIMFKRAILENVPKWISLFGVGDTALLYLAITRGSLGYMEDKMCVYRTTDKNWSAHDEVFGNKLKNYETNIKAYEGFNLQTGEKFNTGLKKRISRMTYSLLYAYCMEEKKLKKRLLFYKKYKDRLLFKEKCKAVYFVFFK